MTSQYHMAQDNVDFEFEFCPTSLASLMRYQQGAKLPQLAVGPAFGARHPAIFTILDLRCICLDLGRNLAPL